MKCDFSFSMKSLPKLVPIPFGTLALVAALAIVALRPGWVPRADG